MGDTAGLEKLITLGVVPVIRTPTAHMAQTAVSWLRDAGVGTFEITLTIPNALDLVRELGCEEGLHVGVGTVLDAAQARASVAAGARYVVSPALCMDIAAPCQEVGVPFLLGAATPSEVLAAVAAGSSAVKIFPVSSVGGAAHVKALKAVFPQVALAPTGGIAVEEVGRYLEAGADFVGVGGRLVDVAALRRGDRDAITTAAATALDQVRLARSRAVP